MKRKTLRLICFPIIGFIVAIFLAITIAYGVWKDTITPLLFPPIVDSTAVEEASAEGEALAKEIMAEGAVLVKNNGVLPLENDNKNVNVFGWGSSPRGWVIGGSGSGRLVSNERGDYYADTTFVDALNEYGASTYTALTDYYSQFCNERPGLSGNGTLQYSAQDFYKIVEPDIDSYPSSLKSGAENFSDTAFVVISRCAGEAKDPPRVQYKYNAATDSSRTYLEISTEEEKLLNYVAGAYENVIVIINSTNTMELGFLDTIEGIDACLIVGGTGVNAASALPELIYGEVSPSGRLADTYAYEFETNVNYYHTGDVGEGKYTNGDDLLLVGVNQNAGSADRHGNSYIDYIENIYVGYKWYETADAEGVWNNVSNGYGTGYEGVVQYPFGYGLGYEDKNDIEWNVTSVSPAAGSELKADDEITITMLVTNNSDRAIKDVVELYYAPPYDEKDAPIEKASVNLGAFAKTVSIEPGLSQTLTLTVPVSDMKSYDAYNVNNNGHYGYELEAGDYVISLRTDAHTVKNTTGVVSGGSITYKISEDILLDANGNKVDEATNTNKFTGDRAFDGVSIDAEDEVDGGLPFVSRASFPTSAPAKEADRAISDEARALNRYTQEMATAWDNASTDIFGNPVNTEPHIEKSGNLKITTNTGNEATELGLALGGNYDDERWDDLLAQVSMSEMTEFVKYSTATHVTPAINSIGLYEIHNLDGPAQIGGYWATNYLTTGFPNETVMAQTWNVELVKRFGSALGKEAVAKGVRGWFGPGVNMHRSPFAGRNYEYYSEDALLTGKLGAAAVTGAKNAGMYCYLKHLVLYEAESNREALYTWLSEQSLREIYLKPFEIIIKEAGSVGIMTAYNRLGAVWAGGSEALMTGVLRNEWGYKGAIITDYSDNGEYMNIDQAVRAGGNRFMSTNGNWLYSTSSARLQSRIKEGFKDYLYTYLNAFWQNKNPVDSEVISMGETRQAYNWLTPLIIDIDLAVLFGCGLWAYMLLRPKNKPKEDSYEIVNNEGGAGDDKI